MPIGIASPGSSVSGAIRSAGGAGGAGPASVTFHTLANPPVTATMRAFVRKFDHFDMADAVDFVSIESNVATQTKAAELACDVDMLRSLKKSDIKTPDGDGGFCKCAVSIRTSQG